MSVRHGGRRHLLTRGSKLHENGFSWGRAIKTFWNRSHCHLFSLFPLSCFCCFPSMISVKDGSQFKPNWFFLFPFIRKCSLCLWKVLGMMLWTKTNSLKGLNLGLMNIHRRLSLIGPLSPRGKPIGDAGAGSEEPDKVKENHKTFILSPLHVKAHY